MLEIAVSKENVIRKLSCTVNWNSLKNRYVRLQNIFNKSDRKKYFMGVVGGEIGELGEVSILGEGK